MLGRREEENVAFEALAVLEHERAQRAALVIESRDRLRPHGNLVAREARPRSPIDALAVGADDDVRAPGLQSQCQSGGMRAAAERREPPAAPLPAVAVRAVKDR